MDGWINDAFSPYLVSSFLRYHSGFLNFIQTFASFYVLCRGMDFLPLGVRVQCNFIWKLF